MPWARQWPRHFDDTAHRINPLFIGNTKTICELFAHPHISPRSAICFVTNRAHIDAVDAKTLGVGAAIGLRKEDADLKKNIDKALAEIIADGTYKKLEKKYFSFSIY